MHTGQVSYRSIALAEEGPEGAEEGDLTAPFVADDKTESGWIESHSGFKVSCSPRNLLMSTSVSVTVSCNMP